MPRTRSRSRSRSREYRRRSRSLSREYRKRSRSRDRRRSSRRSRSRSHERTRWGKRDHSVPTNREEVVPKEEPCYIPSGNLYTDDSMKKKKKIKPEDRLKYSEPGDASHPDLLWRFYVFKNEECIETLHVSKLSFYVIGKDEEQCQIVAQHPSISKFHAVLQFRKKVTRDKIGNPVLAIRPYLIDLGSTNGTSLNGEKMEELRYYELLEKDCIKFGASTREYVIMHDQLED